MKITYLLTTSKAHIVLIESVLMPLVPTLGVLGTYFKVAVGSTDRNGGPTTCSHIADKDLSRVTAVSMVFLMISI